LTSGHNHIPSHDMRANQSICFKKLTEFAWPTFIALICAIFLASHIKNGQEFSNETFGKELLTMRILGCTWTEKHIYESRLKVK